MGLDRETERFPVALERKSAVWWLKGSQPYSIFHKVNLEESGPHWAVQLGTQGCQRTAEKVEIPLSDQRPLCLEGIWLVLHLASRAALTQWLGQLIFPFLAPGNVEALILSKLASTSSPTLFFFIFLSSSTQKYSLLFMILSVLAFCSWRVMSRGPWRPSSHCSHVLSSSCLGALQTSGRQPISTEQKSDFSGFSTLLRCLWDIIRIVCLWWLCQHTTCKSKRDFFGWLGWRVGN